MRGRNVGNSCANGSHAENAPRLRRGMCFTWRDAIGSRAERIAPFTGLRPPKAGLSPRLLALGFGRPSRHSLSTSARFSGLVSVGKPAEAGWETEEGGGVARGPRAKSPGLCPAFASLRRAKPHEWGSRLDRQRPCGRSGLDTYHEASRGISACMKAPTTRETARRR